MNTNSLFSLSTGLAGKEKLAQFDGHVKWRIDRIDGHMLNGGKLVTCKTEDS